MLEACGREQEWPEGIAAAVAAALDFAAADPHAANLLTTESLSRGAAGFARYERLISYLSEHLLEGRRERGDSEPLPEITEHALASGVATMVAQRLDQGKEGELTALTPEVIQFVLTPYVGAERARQAAGGINR